MLHAPDPIRIPPCGGIKEAMLAFLYIVGEKVISHDVPGAAYRTRA